MADAVQGPDILQENDARVVIKIVNESDGSGATTIDMTASYYGWFQTHGPAALLTDGTLTLVSPAVRSDGTAGAVEVLDSDADAEGQVIGQVMCVSADSEYSLIWMNL